MKVILIVEPDLQRRKALCEHHSSFGCVLEADSASHAERILGDLKIDTVVIEFERTSVAQVRGMLKMLAKIPPEALVVWHSRAAK